MFTAKYVELLYQFQNLLTVNDYVLAGSLMIYSLGNRYLKILQQLSAYILRSAQWVSLL